MLLPPVRQFLIPCLTFSAGRMSASGWEPICLRAWNQQEEEGVLLQVRIPWGGNGGGTGAGEPGRAPDGMANPPETKVLAVTVPTDTWTPGSRWSGPRGCGDPRGKTQLGDPGRWVLRGMRWAHPEVMPLKAEKKPEQDRVGRGGGAGGGGLGPLVSHPLTSDSGSPLYPALQSLCFSPGAGAAAEQSPLAARPGWFSEITENEAAAC